MRDVANKEKLLSFMRSFGRRAHRNARVYFTGGATAVLRGWRDSTIDLDLKFDPELDELFRALPEIKEELQINIELAAPSDFIPPLPGWETRCEYIGREGKVSYYHYDYYSQALSKIERGHAQDVKDVEAMFQEGVLEQRRLLSFYEEIEPHIYRYPAIDPVSFSDAVRQVAGAKS